MYAEIHRVLKPRGVLLVSDDRNGFHLRVRAATKRIWKVAEFGGAEELAKLGMKESYAQMRLRFLRNEFADVAAETAQRIALTSRGHTFRTLRTLVEAQ